MDYWTLNKYIKRDRYPLSCISELLNMIRCKHYLSKINLLSGYWQVLLIDKMILKMAFNMIFGKFK